MLEKVAVKVLSKLLNQYIANFDAKQLNLSVTTGRATMHNVELRADALSALLGTDAAALTLLHGAVGDLELTLPWQKLGSKPSVVVAKRVVLVLGTSRPAAAAREALLGNADAAAATLARAAALARESLDQNSLTAKLVAKVLANLQVRVEGVSVRLVDRHAPRPCAFGLLVASLALESTDVNWKPTLASPKDATLFKLVQIDGLAIYHDADHSPAAALLPAATAAARDALLWSQASAKAPPPTVKWIVEPMRCALRVTWPQRATGGALLQIGLQCDRVALDVEPTNVDAIVELAAFFVAHTRRQLYAHLRSTSMNTPMARWRYLRDCVLLRLRERDGTLCRSWPALLVFCKQRRQYMQLWRQYLASPDDPTVLQCVQLAESALRPTDVRLFRDLVARSQKSSRRSRALSSAGTTAAPLPATPSAAATAKPSGAKKFAAAFAARLKRNKKAPPTDTVSADEVEQLLMDVSNDNGTDDDEPGKSSSESSTTSVAAAETTNIVASKIVVGFDLRSVSLRVFDRSGGTTPLLEVLTSDASLSFDLAPRSVGVSGKIQSFYVLHHRPADVRFAKLIDVSARAANVASTAVVVLDCRVDSRETDLLTLLSTLEPTALRTTVVHVGLTVLPIDITLHCGVVRQLCDAFLADTVLRCAQELLSVRIWNRPEPVVVAATPSRVRAAALLGFPRLVLNCTYHAPTVILPTTAALGGQTDDGDAGAAVPPLFVLCFGRLSATSPADAAHSTANEQTINLLLDTMRVVFSNNVRADEADESSGLVTLIDRSDVRAMLRIVGGADTGMRCEIDASRLHAQLSHSMAARGAQIVSDSLGALIDNRSTSWRFFSSMSRYAGSKRRRHARRSVDARAMRSASIRVRVPSLEFDVLDDIAGETVISSSIDSVVRSMCRATRVTSSPCARRCARSLLRDISEQRRHAQRAITAPNVIECAGAVAAAARRIEYARRRRSGAHVSTRAGDTGASGVLRVELEKSRVSCCLNRETVLFLYRLCRATRGALWRARRPRCLPTCSRSRRRRLRWCRHRQRCVSTCMLARLWYVCSNQRHVRCAACSCSAAWCAAKRRRVARSASLSRRKHRARGQVHEPPA
jgi:hypothetical protein